MSLGFPEIVVILVIALLVFGPDKLPEAARKAGQLVSDVRNFQENIRREVENAMREAGAPGYSDPQTPDATPPSETLPSETRPSETPPSETLPSETRPSPPPPPPPPEQFVDDHAPPPPEPPEPPPPEPPASGPGR